MSLAKTAPGSAEYYIQYAADGSERPGEWMGKGAKQLGLSGKVDPDQLRNLFKGLHPDGSKHLINVAAIRKDRAHVPAWDLALSAPKDVSLLGGLFEEMKVKVDRGQREGVRAAVEYIEMNCAFTRRGSGGKQLERCKPIIACFDHLTSRNNDPQWHSHLLILNVGAHGDGFGTIVSKFLYDHQTAINGVYLAALAKSLQRDLGVTIQAKELKAFEPGDTFKIEGIPDKLRDLMSSRRAEILSARAKVGATTGTEHAALATRQAKTHVPLSILKTHWKKAAESIGVDLGELKVAILKGVSEKQLTPPIQPDATEESHKQQKAALSKNNVRPFVARGEPRDERAVPDSSSSPQAPQMDSADPISPKVAASLVEAVTRSAVAAKIPSPIVERLIDQVLYEFDRKHRPERLKNHASKKGDSQKALAGLLADCDQISNDGRHKIDANNIKRGVAGPMTSRDADVALVQALAKTGAIVCVETKAGVDSNLFIAALAREYKKAGFKVKAFTPSPAGASELETATGTPVHTVGQLLYRLKSTALSAGVHHAVQILRASMDLPTVERWRFDSKTVVCVTQAQGLRSADLARIVGEAKSTHAKVVLLGAPDQIARREPHNAFSEITERVGKVTLPDPAIQSEEWMKDAVSQVARGDVRGAFSQYVLADRLHLAKDQRAATVELANYWQTLPKLEQNGKTLIIADSARDARVLNKLAQNARWKSGGLGLLMRQRVDGTWVRRGDRVLFRIGSKHHGFKAGDLGTIEKIGLKGMRIRLDRTKWALLARPAIRVDVPKSLYRGLTLGYAVTATDAQSLTCDRALVLPRAGGKDLRGLLVQLSRAREDTRIFTSTRSVGEDIESINNSFRRQQQTARVAAPAPEQKPVNEESREDEKVRSSPTSQRLRQKQDVHL